MSKNTSRKIAAGLTLLALVSTNASASAPASTFEPIVTTLVSSTASQLAVPAMATVAGPAVLAAVGQGAKMAADVGAKAAIATARSPAHATILPVSASRTMMSAMARGIATRVRTP